VCVMAMLQVEVEGEPGFVDYRIHLLAEERLG
jgi:hypothetical protein